MAKKEEYKATKTEEVAAKTNQWIGKNAKALIAVCSVVIVLLLALVIVFAVSNNKRENAFTSLTALDTSYANIQEVGDEQFINECKALISEAGLDTYPGAKAALYLADVSFDNKDYATALEYYNNIANAQNKTYLYQVAKVNAAACHEMLGDASAALDIYNNLWDSYGKDGIFASRVLFNSARLYEENGNLDLAKATYEQLVGEFEALQSEYASLAKTRLAQLN